MEMNSCFVFNLFLFFGQHRQNNNKDFFRRRRRRPSSLPHSVLFSSLFLIKYANTHDRGFLSFFLSSFAFLSEEKIHSTHIDDDRAHRVTNVYISPVERKKRKGGNTLTNVEHFLIGQQFFKKNSSLVKGKISQERMRERRRNTSTETHRISHFLP